MVTDYSVLYNFSMKFHGTKINVQQWLPTEWSALCRNSSRKHTIAGPAPLSWMPMSIIDLCSIELHAKNVKHSKVCYHGNLTVYLLVSFSSEI